MSLAFEPPKNAIYIILGEIQAIVSSKKTNTRWSNTPTYEVHFRLQKTNESMIYFSGISRSESISKIEDRSEFNLW